MARKIEVEIVGDARSLNRALGSAGKSSSKAGRAIGTGIKAGAVAAGAAIAGLAVVAKIGFDEFSEAAKVTAQTNAVLKSTGRVANVSAKGVENLAESLMMKSGVDDEAIQSGENMLLTFKNIRNEVGAGNDIFNQATEAALDMSVAMGTDVKSAALTLGKAMNDPVKGLTKLTRQGVTFTEGQVKMIEKMVEAGDTMGAQKIILKELNSEFGGSAEALGKTLPGQIDILKNRFENFAGDLVGRILPRVLEFFGGIGTAISRVVNAKGFKAKVKVVWTGVQSVAVDLFEKLRDSLFGHMENKTIRLPIGKAEVESTWHQGLVASIAAGLAGMDWTAIGKKVGAGISASIEFTADWVTKFLQSVEENIDKIADVGAQIAIAIVNKLMDPAFWAAHWKEFALLSMSLIPFGVFGRVGGRIGLMILRPIGRIVPEGIRVIGARIVALLTGAANLLPAPFRAAATKAIAFLGRIVAWVGGKLKAALGKVPGYVMAAFRFGAIVTFIGWINTAIRAVQDLIGWLGRIGSHIPNLPDWLPSPKNFLPGNQFATGGIVTRPMVGLVGEAGPEAIIPLNKMGAMGGGPTIIVRGNVYGVDDMTRLVQNAMFSRVPVAEPTLTVELALTTPPLDPAPSWTDVSQYVRGFGYRRGASSELDQVSAGTAYVVLDNRTGRFTPSNTSGPYYGNLLPNRLCRVTAEWSASDYDQFHGFIEAFEQTWVDPDEQQTVLRLVDGFKALNLEHHPTFDDYPSEVDRVLEPWGYWRLNEPPVSRSKPGGKRKVRGSGPRKHPKWHYEPKRRKRWTALVGSSGPEAQVQGNPGFLWADGDGPITGEMTTGILFGGIQSQRLRIPVEEADDRPGAENKLVLSVIVQPAALSGVMVKGPFVTALSGSGYTLSLSAGTVTFQVAPNDGLGVRSVGTGSVFAVGDWVHIVATWRGTDGNMQIYVNGALEAETFADPGTLLRGDTGAPVYIAADPNLAGGTAFFNGIMAELVISEQDLNRDGLAAANVEQLYRASVAGFGSPDHLVAPGTRIGEIIAGLPDIGVEESYFSVTGLFDLSQGETELLPQRIDESRLDLIRAVEETDAGLLFVSKAGELTYRSADWFSTTGATITGTFSSYPLGAYGVVPYTNVETSYDDSFLFPIVSVTREDGVTQTVGDADVFLGVGLEVNDTLHTTDSASNDYATKLHEHYHLPAERVVRLDLHGGTDPDTVYPQMLGRELGDRVTVNKHNPDGSRVFGDCRIAGMSLDVTPAEWTASWDLRPSYFPDDGYWHLGVTGLSELGTTTTLG